MRNAQLSRAATHLHDVALINGKASVHPTAPGSSPKAGDGQLAELGGAAEILKAGVGAAFNVGNQNVVGRRAAGEILRSKGEQKQGG